MAIQPLLSALMRNKAGPLLIVFQIAFTLALCVNAAHLIALRKSNIDRPPGLDTNNTFTLSSDGYGRDFDYPSSIRADLTLLNSLSGVIAATTINNVPLGPGFTTLNFYTAPNQGGIAEAASVYMTTELGPEALGVRLTEGKTFSAGIVAPPLSHEGTQFDVLAMLPPEIIITKTLAKKLFPHGGALGKTIYGYLDRPVRIVGIMENMLGAIPWWSKNDQVVIVPGVPAGFSVTYLIRTKPGRRDELMRLAEEKLSTSLDNRIISRVLALEKTKKLFHATDQIMVTVLSFVISVVIGVMGLGMFGLAMFYVTSRHKHIGIRRALGARKSDITFYFLLENWLITTIGLIIGSILAIFIGTQLNFTLGTPRLPLFYLVAGIISFWGVGLLATYIPANRASQISPAIATRSI